VDVVILLPNEEYSGLAHQYINHKIAISCLSLISIRIFIATYTRDPFHNINVTSLPVMFKLTNIEKCHMCQRNIKIGLTWVFLL